MSSTESPLHTLQDIRHMMKQSSKFLSLSGLSGIFAGIYALAGITAVSIIIENFGEEGYERTYGAGAYYKALWQCVFVAVSVLGLSLITALLFSARKARVNGQKLFDHTAWRLLLNLSIPLLAGGLFCLALIIQGVHVIPLLSPAMLLFYGLALVNGSKYTLEDIRYLGYCEILLGILAAFFINMGLIFWALGFGVLHIIYGTVMWYKYERH
ncbi:MAG: hypothetical protein QM534_07515 [Sediminibacterium sp.]|nr:hypothetical protein [Sediminibacterium sp.]